MNDQPDPHRELIDFAEDARRAIRSLNHASRGGALPGPAVYDLTGTLKNVGLPQLYEQLAIGLELSLAVYDVKEDDGADSSERVSAAATALRAAAQHATDALASLEVAQAAVAQQVYAPHN